MCQSRSLLRSLTSPFHTFLYSDCQSGLSEMTLLTRCSKLSSRMMCRGGTKSTYLPSWCYSRYEIMDGAGSPCIEMFCFSSLHMIEKILDRNLAVPVTARFSALREVCLPPSDGLLYLHALPMKYIQELSMQRLNQEVYPSSLPWRKQCLGLLSHARPGASPLTHSKSHSHLQYDYFSVNLHFRDALVEQSSFKDHE